MQKPLCPICYSDLNIRNDHRREGVCYCQNCGKKILLSAPGRRSGKPTPA